jgi:hypothetical protein
MSGLFPRVPTFLDLNGPELSFVEQPVNATTSVASGTVSFVGIATATFPEDQQSRNENSGYIAYRWYRNGELLTDSGNVVGAATTTLILSGLESSDDGTNVFVRVDYVPSAYESGATGNAYNEPLDSNTATITVFPTFEITNQPENLTVVQNTPAVFSVDATTSNGSESKLTYQWSLNRQPLVDDGVFVIGSQSKQLRITRSIPTLERVFCTVSHPTAQPSVLTTTEVKLDITSERNILNYERFGAGSGGGVLLGSRDLIAGGHLSFRADANIEARTIVVYPSEKDVDVKITLGAAAGADRGNYRGGNGGISVFKMRMIKNTEYVIKLGVNSLSPLGGGPKGGKNGGGGLAVVYRKATVIAVCGGGGGAGINGRGGDGGGLQIAGEDGKGRNHGIGGEFFSVDNLGVAGSTQAGRKAYNQFDTESSGGGKLGGCTLGNYWHIQGKTPCEDVGNVRFYNSDGVINEETSILTRGYKSGQGFRNNGGAASGNQGGGGAGARGGSGALGDGAGGGGASGYASSEIELLNSLELPGGTELGGNNDVAFITFEAFITSSDNNYPPHIPPASGTPMLSERTVTWNISRSTGFALVTFFGTILNENTVTFKKESGVGPESLTWGPNSANITSQISKDAVYVFSSSTSSLGRELIRRLDGNTLRIEDGRDNDFDDLTITPSHGRFTSDSRWVADWLI